MIKKEINERKRRMQRNRKRRKREEFNSIMKNVNKDMKRKIKITKVKKHTEKKHGEEK